MSDMEVSGDTLFECLSDIKAQLKDIQSEVSAVKTDVAWLKRIVVLAITIAGSIIGVDVSGLLH